MLIGAVGQQVPQSGWRCVTCNPSHRWTPLGNGNAHLSNPYLLDIAHQLTPDGPSTCPAQVIVTNTIPVLPENQFPGLTVLSVANLLGETIWRVYNATSVQSIM